MRERKEREKKRETTTSDKLTNVSLQWIIRSKVQFVLHLHYKICFFFIFKTWQFVPYILTSPTLKQQYFSSLVFQYYNFLSIFNLNKKSMEWIEKSFNLYVKRKILSWKMNMKKMRLKSTFNSDCLFKLFERGREREREKDEIFEQQIFVCLNIAQERREGGFILKINLEVSLFLSRRIEIKYLSVR